MKVFLVAAEASGDAIGGDLIDALRRREPTVQIAGVGGAQMAARGVRSSLDISDLAILGFVDGLLAYKRVVAKAEEAATAAAAFRPDVVVLIDSWGFTLRVAQRIRAIDPSIKLLKYIGPQVWATRAGRAKTLAAAVDHLVCIHDFEEPYYAPFGLPTTVCGHPAIGRFRPGDGAAFRARHGVGDAPLLLVLPGSRLSELRRTAPFLFAAAERVVRTQPSLRIAVVAAPAVEREVALLAARQPYPILIVREGEEKDDAFASATAALAVSGTVTTEVAMQDTPVVVAYRLGWITWAIGRAFLFKGKYATLMNTAAGREVAPEFIQTKCTVRNLAQAVDKLLSDGAARRSQVDAQNAALAAMGRGGRPASEVAADAVFALAVR